MWRPLRQHSPSTGRAASGRNRLRKPHRGRIVVVAVLLLICLCLLWARLLHVQVLRHEYYARKAVNQHFIKAPIMPRRGRIFDRNGEGIAVSKFMDSIYLDIRKAPMELDAILAKRLSETFDLPVENLLQSLRRNNVRVVARDVPPGRRADAQRLIDEFDLASDAILCPPPDAGGAAGPADRVAVAVNIRKIPLSAETQIARRLGEAVDLPTTAVLRAIKENTILPIARKVPLDKVAEALDLIHKYKLPRDTIFPVKESKRSYPHDQLAAHVIGYTTTDEKVSGDNKGIDGVEKRYDETLCGNWARYEVLCDARHRRIEPIDDEEYFSTYGNDVHLTIDSVIQTVAERELARMVDYQKADAGGVVVMDCRSGELLAMANYPTFNPNDFAAAPTFVRTNRCVTNVFETGSVMKIFLAAALLEGNLVTLEEIVDCKGGRAMINGHAIRDAPGHTLYLAPFREVFQCSSNVGCATVAQRIEPPDYGAWMRRFGFCAPTGVDLPGEARGLMAANLKPVDRDRVAIGYSIAVTPIQVATALCAIANHGVAVKPHVVREIRDCHGATVYRFEQQTGERLLSSVAAKQVLELMEGVVEEGTGQKAQLDGYVIGGKTGTALKINENGRGYSTDRYVSAFACVAPIDDPRLVIYCFVDEPKRQHYGGDVAAPIVMEVAKVALRVLGVMPSKALQQPLPDPELVADGFRQRAREQLAAATAPPVDGDAPLTSDALTLAPGPRMPELLGLTMREAQERLSALPLHVTFQGSGLVVAQDPQPFAELTGRRAATILFSRPQDVAPPL